MVLINDFAALENQFLVSTPQLHNSNFKQAVILMCKHDHKGSVGIVINRLTEHLIGDIFEQLGIDISSDHYSNKPVLDGGPIYPDLGLIVHNKKFKSSTEAWESSIDIGEQLRLTSSKDILADMARGEGPEKAFMSLGYAGWAPGQLEKEIQENAWFTTPADHEILFSGEMGNKWQRSAQLLGIDPNNFSAQVGHA
ncbi:UPF0301 protein YqgE [uncultured Candidatus Thioglobus sp.]|nr:UPF0301 protein YqgE [uncultured Candidatus Thioglobus sp.]